MLLLYMDSWETEQRNVGIDIAVNRSGKVLMIGWQSHNHETSIWWLL